MSLNDREVATLLEHHATAISTLTIANIEKLIYELKGTEEPQEAYAKGYRDAMDTVLIRLRALNSALAIRKPEATNE
jgi:hypothetical protein